MIELNKPALRGTKDYEKIEELRRYLFSLIDDLQFVLEDIDGRLIKIEKKQASDNTAVASYSLPTPDAVAYDEITEGEENNEL